MRQGARNEPEPSLRTKSLECWGSDSIRFLLLPEEVCQKSLHRTPTLPPRSIVDELTRTYFGRTTDILSDFSRIPEDAALDDSSEVRMYDINAYPEARKFGICLSLQKEASQNLFTGPFSVCGAAATVWWAPAIPEI